MLAVTHTVTSAAIGVHIQSVPFAFGIALLFHLFADTLLHWNIFIDRHRWPYAWAALDVFGGVLLTYWLIPEQFTTAPVVAAIVGGNLPDVWHGSVELLKKFKRRERQPPPPGWFYRFHEGLQHETLSPAKGLAWQVVLGIVAVLLF